MDRLFIKFRKPWLEGFPEIRASFHLLPGDNITYVISRDINANADARVSDVYIADIAFNEDERTEIREIPLFSELWNATFLKT